VDLEACIDLRGIGQPAEFRAYAWLHLGDILPLTQTWKRGVYAHLIREFQPLISRLRAVHVLQQDFARLPPLPAPEQWLLSLSPEAAVASVIEKFGASFVLAQAAAAVQQQAAFEREASSAQRGTNESVAPSTFLPARGPVLAVYNQPCHYLEVPAHAASQPAHAQAWAAERSQFVHQVPAGTPSSVSQGSRNTGTVADAELPAAGVQAPDDPGLDNCAESTAGAHTALLELGSFSNKGKSGLGSVDIVSGVAEEASTSDARLRGASLESLPAGEGDSKSGVAGVAAGLPAIPLAEVGEAAAAATVGAGSRATQDAACNLGNSLNPPVGSTRDAGKTIYGVVTRQASALSTSLIRAAPAPSAAGSPFSTVLQPAAGATAVASFSDKYPAFQATNFPWQTARQPAAWPAACQDRAPESASVDQELSKDMPARGASASLDGITERSSFKASSSTQQQEAKTGAQRSDALLSKSLPEEPSTPSTGCAALAAVQAGPASADTPKGLPEGMAVADMLGERFHGCVQGSDGQEPWQRTTSEGGDDGQWRGSNGYDASDDNNDNDKRSPDGSRILESVGSMSSSAWGTACGTNSIAGSVHSLRGASFAVAGIGGSTASASIKSKAIQGDSGVVASPNAGASRDAAEWALVASLPSVGGGEQEESTVSCCIEPGSRKLSERARAPCMCSNGKGGGR
jgi:hypothetical protein